MTVTHARSGGPSALSGAEAALARARDHLLGLQHEQGWWQGELETNVTMDAEDLLLREFLGIRTEEETAAAARWIASQQRADGTWANFFGGPGDLSTTVEAYVALRLGGHLPSAPHMTRAAEWINSRGGIPATRVFTRIWLALFGQWSWDDLPVMPPEMVYLPTWFPLNVYDWACWARQTIVPLTVVGSLRPVRSLPFGLDEIRAPGQDGPGGRARKSAQAADRTGWELAFGGLDRVLHVLERHGQRTRPVRAMRRAALRRCADWIIARQEQDGCWGGIQPPWVYSLIALHLLGYGLDHPVIKRGLAGLDRFTICEDSPDGPVRRLEACQSPVWDTVLAVVALADAGLPPEHPALTRAADWLLDEEIPGPGDWQVRRPWLEPGGWAFEFDNDGYPDIDDTAEAVLALRRTAQGSRPGRPAPPAPRHRPRAALDHRHAVRRRRVGGLRRGQHLHAGDQAAVLRLRCGRRSAVGRCHRPRGRGAGRGGPGRQPGRPPGRGVAAAGPGAGRFLVRPLGGQLRVRHRRGGACPGRGGGPAVQAGHPARGPLAGSPPEPGRRLGRGPALLRRPGAGRAGLRPPLRRPRGRCSPCWRPGPPGPAAEAGVRWLAEHQRADGTWDEPQYTGTGFPGDFYINYHLYRLVFPVTALGRYLAARP